MDRRKSKGVIIAIIALTVFVAVAAIVIAYYYSQIKDVTPGQSSAANPYCACYVFPAGTASCPANGSDSIQGAIYTEIGNVAANTCSATCENINANPALSSNTDIVQAEYKGPTTSTCAAQFGNNCVAASDGNCVCYTSVPNTLKCTAASDGSIYQTNFSSSTTKYCSNLSVTGAATPLGLGIITTPIDANLPSIDVISTFYSTTDDINSFDANGSSFLLTINSTPVTDIVPTISTPDVPVDGVPLFYVYTLKWTIPNSYYNDTTKQTLSISTSINNASVNYQPCNRVFQLSRPTLANLVCNTVTITPDKITASTSTNKLDGIEINFTLPEGTAPDSYRFEYKIVDSTNATIADVTNTSPIFRCNPAGNDHCIKLSADGKTGTLTLLQPYLYDGNNFINSDNSGVAKPFPNFPSPTGTNISSAYKLNVSITPLYTSSSKNASLASACQAVDVTVNAQQTAGPTCQLVLTPTSSTTGSLTITSATFYTNATLPATSSPAATATFTFPGSNPAITSVQNVPVFPITGCQNPAGTICIGATATQLSAANFPVLQAQGTGTNPTTYNVRGALLINGNTIACDPLVALSVAPAPTQGETPGGATSNFTVSKTGPRCVERVAPNNSGTFTITITNAATSSQPLRSFKDKLPMGFTYVPNSTTINGAVVPDSGLVTTNPVGNSQEIIWTKTGNWAMTNGEVMVVTFRAVANTNAITGQNQNEVVLDPLNLPVTATSIRTEYVFSVASNCSTPSTGIFDETEGKIGIGLIVLIIGLVFYYTSFGTQVSANLATNPIAINAGKLGTKVRDTTKNVKVSVADKAKMTWLKIAYPTKYFEEKTMRRKKKD